MSTKILLLYLIACIIITYKSFANWERIVSPSGGTITQITYTNAQLYALALNSGIFQIDYLQGKWEKVNKTNDLLRTSLNFEVDTSNSFFYTYINKKGIYRSSDKVQWEKIHSGLNAENKELNINKIKAYDKILAFTSDSAAYLSRDYGNTWTNISKDLGKFRIYDILYYKSKVYLASEKGLFISDNLGNEWQKVAFADIPVYGIYNLYDKITACVLVPNSPNSTFMMYEKEDVSDTFQVYSGSTFKDLQILNIATFNTNIAVFTLNITDNKYNYNVFLSSNSGGNWEKIKSYPDNISERFTSAFTMDLNKIYIGTIYDGIFTIEYSNGSEHYSNIGLDGITISSFIEDKDIDIAASYLNGIYYKAKKSNEWLRSESSPNISTQSGISFKNINKVIRRNGKYYAATNLGIYQSVDGKTWNEYALLEYMILDITLVNNTMYALGNFNSGYLFTSTDDGVNWSSKKLPNDAIALSYLADKNSIFVGTTLGLMQSNDGGNSWNIINSEFIGENIIKSITKQKNNTLLLCTNKNVYFSIDGGVKWVKSSEGLANAAINNLISSDNIAITATNAGTAISYDYGVNWTYMNDGLEEPNVWKVSTNDSIVYAFQFGGGIYKNNIILLSPIKIVNKINKIICKESEFSIEYQVRAGLKLNPDNKFYVQLSNKDGFFDESSIIIGEVAAVTDGTINVTIPKDIESGNSYRFRVISTSPKMIGLDNLADIAIIDKPSPKISGDIEVCEHSEHIYNIENIDGLATKWSVDGGEILGNDNESSVKIKWTTTGSRTLYVTQSSIANCDGQDSFKIKIYPVPDKPAISFINDTLISSSDNNNQWYYEGNKIENANGKFYIPKQDGNYSVQVIGEFDCNSEISDNFNFVDQSGKLVFMIDSTQGYSGDFITLKIRLLKNKKYYQSNIKSIKADLEFNASLLYPNDVDKGVVIAGKRYLSINIDTNYITDNIVWAQEMTAMLGNSDNTNINLTNLKINDVPYSDVIIQNGNFFMQGICYEGGARLVTTVPKATIINVSPNPSGNIAKITVQSDNEQEVKLYLTDILGNVLENIYIGNLGKGEKSFNLNTVNYPPGNYYINAKTQYNVSSYQLVIAR
ncbi:MAG TPA: hypothetical protein PLE30_07110 [Candidatus Kapabacteria bacterium]|nr:hypothetical protein [Candidatus Kapabacteria bacterium]